MARNYFKAITGTMVSGGVVNSGSVTKRADPLREAVFFFDDLDPEDMRGALRRARAAFSKGAVSVWRQAITVPDSVPEVGESPAFTSAIMQPGQVSAARFRQHVAGLLDVVGAE